MTHPIEQAIGAVERELADLRAMIDDCAPYLKDGETPRQRMDRDHQDVLSLMQMLAKDRAERDDLRAKLAVAVEALDYLVRAFDRVVGNSNHFYENVHRRDVHLMVEEGAKIQSVADARAAIEDVKK